MYDELQFLCIRDSSDVVLVSKEVSRPIKVSASSRIGRQHLGLWAQVLDLGLSLGPLGLVLIPA